MSRQVCHPCRCKTSSIEKWYAHLRSPEHQVFAAERFPPSGKHARTVVGSEWNLNGSLSRSPEEIMKLFEGCGTIEDIYFQRLGGEFPNIITAVHVLLEKSQEAERFVEKWYNSSGKNGLKDGLKEACSAVFDILEKMNWRAWYRDISSIEKTWRAELKHEILLAKVSAVPSDQQLEVFMKELSLSEDDQELRIRTLENLSQFIRKRFPSCQLHPFGSYLTGLSSPESDIDVYVDVSRDMDRFECSVEESMEYLYNEFMRVPSSDRGKKQFKDVVYIRHARVPIIRVVDKATNIQLDLSFNTEISLNNSKLIKFYLDFNPLVKPFMMLIRYWANYYGLIDSSKIKSYGLNLMTIVFFNQLRVLPSIAYLQKLIEAKRVKIDGYMYNVAFCEDVEFVKQSIVELQSNAVDSAVDLNSMLTLAVKFFSLYGCEDLEESFVCALQGTIVRKTLLTEEDAFVEYLGTDVNTSKLCSGSLTIQDPFVLHINVNCPGRTIVDRFQELCNKAFCSLRAKLQGPDQSLNLSDIFVDD